MANSINTNIAAYYAQANIGIAAQSAQASVARLSSGNRIVLASDDVAALSAGTSLQNNATALRAAQGNVSQGTSLLQVADGGLAQIQAILNQQKSIALQAGSGSLTNTDRSFLNQQFQALSAQIDSLAGGTTFNGVGLLDGSLSTSAGVTDKTTNATAGSSTLTLNVNPADAQTIIINGVTLTAKNTPAAATDFQIGVSIAQTIANLATKLNQLADGTVATSAANATALGRATYTATGNTLVATAKSGGAYSNAVTISTAGTATNDGLATISNNGGSGLSTTFNLFTTASAATLTSTTQAVSAGAAAAGTPFQNGNTIQAIINGAVQGGTPLTLHTVAAGDTLTTVVNGINNGTTTHGFTAQLVYNGANYNVQLSYNSLATAIEISGGANYHSGTFKLTGDNIDTAVDVRISGAASSNTQRRSVVFQSYTDIAANTTITTANDNAADATNTAGNTAAGTPFLRGNSLSITLAGQTRVLYTIPNAATTLNAIVDGINANSNVTGVVAKLLGSGGSYGLRLYYNDPNALAAAGVVQTGLGNHAVLLNNAAVVTGSSVISQNVVGGLGGGLDNGLNLGSTLATGAVGDSILQTLGNTRPQQSILLTQNAVANNFITVGGKAFYFTANSTNKAPDEITLSTKTNVTEAIAETLDNAVNTINSYLKNGNALNSTAYELNQMEIFRDGNSIVFRGKSIADVKTLAGAASAVTRTVTGSSLVGSDLANGSGASGAAFGIDTTGITNKSFVGTVSGFAATYRSNNVVDLTVTIGGYTYTAKSAATNPTADTAIRLYSNTLADGTSGGYFDIQVKANNGPLAVTNQTDATNLYAARINGAFSSVSFLQKHIVSSYVGGGSITSGATVIGSLVGTSVTAQLSSFSGLKLSGATVTAPSGSNTDAKITLTVNGVAYSTGNNLGSKLGANQTYKLVSANDPNQFISFTTGNNTIDLSTTAYATAVQTALNNAFGATSGAAALSFQVGAASSDTLSVSIGSAKTSSLFGGLTLDVATQATASAASAAIDIAIQSATALRAAIGGLESRFSFAAAALQTTVQNVDAARGQLLDTDIAAESTAYATSQVKLQAGISVLAQSNQQLQALLKLIG